MRELINPDSLENWKKEKNKYATVAVTGLISMARSHAKLFMLKMKSVVF